MPQPLDTFLTHFRHAAVTAGAPRVTDSQLLALFIARQDEAAFAALVKRHGPMVLGLCRRILGNSHDADDAFQCTFLWLASKAAALQSRERVGNWLCGVAYRTALAARGAVEKIHLGGREVRSGNRGERNPNRRQCKGARRCLRWRGWRRDGTGWNWQHWAGRGGGAEIPQLGKSGDGGGNGLQNTKSVVDAARSSNEPPPPFRRERWLNLNVMGRCIHPRMYRPIVISISREEGRLDVPSTPEIGSTYRATWKDLQDLVGEPADLAPPVRNATSGRIAH